MSVWRRNKIGFFRVNLWRNKFQGKVEGEGKEKWEGKLWQKRKKSQTPWPMNQTSKLLIETRWTIFTSPPPPPSPHTGFSPLHPLPHTQDHRQSLFGCPGVTAATELLLNSPICQGLSKHHRAWQMLNTPHGSLSVVKGLIDDEKEWAWACQTLFSGELWKVASSLNFVPSSLPVYKRFDHFDMAWCVQLRRQLVKIPGSSKELFSPNDKPYANPY